MAGISRTASGTGGRAGDVVSATGTTADSAPEPPSGREAPPTGSRTRGTAPSVDGRVQRGERTRVAIVESLLGLLNAGSATPTAQQIADAAGVSVRSVFQHFEDFEELYGDLAEAQAEHTRELFDALSSDGDRATRIRHLSTHRSTLFEHIAPVRHAIGTRARGSVSLARRLDDVDELLRTQVGQQFAPELAARRGAQRRDLLDVLDLLWSFESWDRLRTSQGLSATAAAATLERTTARLLEPG